MTHNPRPNHFNTKRDKTKKNPDKLNDLSGFKQIILLFRL